MSNPISMSLCIKDINDAIQYWLINAVFKDAIVVQSVQWIERENSFKIMFDRTERETNEQA